MIKLVLAFTFFPAVLFSQSRKERKALEAQQKIDQTIISNLKSHVQNLTSSGVSSQKSGFNAATTVAYISNEFKTVGLSPKGNNGYIQPFTIDEGKIVDGPTFLKVNDAVLQVNKDYFPLAFSAEKKVTGMPAMALRERGVPWFVDVKDWLEDGVKTGADVEDFLKKEASKMASKGASALFVYNSGANADGLIFHAADKSSPLSIPVIYITPEGYKKYFSDHSQILDIELNIAFKNQVLQAENVIGFIDNAAPSTVIVSAHFNSSNKEKLAGADDNASGTAMLIELARMLVAGKTKANNFLFVALGGPGNGAGAATNLLANYPVAAPANYVVNLDMVGSYDQGKKLLVQGYNSSDAWKDIFSQFSDKKQGFDFETNEPVSGALTPFYNKQIPVLCFSSANHTDYANATDEEGKINYPAELQITRMIYRLIEATASKGKLGFAQDGGKVAGAAVAGKAAF